MAEPKSLSLQTILNILTVDQRAELSEYLFDEFKYGLYLVDIRTGKHLTYYVHVPDGSTIYDVIKYKPEILAALCYDDYQTWQSIYFEFKNGNINHDELIEQLEKFDILKDIQRSATIMVTPISYVKPL
jgi:hypothetical protein